MKEQEVRTFETIVSKGRFTLYNFPFHIAADLQTVGDVKKECAIVVGKKTTHCVASRPPCTDPLRILFDQMTSR